MRCCCQIRARCAGSLGLELINFLFQLATALYQRRQLIEHIVATTLHGSSCFAQPLLGIGNPGQRTGASHRLDAAHARGNTAFCGDLEQTDITRARYVGATTQLDGEAVAHGQYAHLVTILLAEQRHRALVFGRLNISDFHTNDGVQANLLVDPVFQSAQLLGLDRFIVTEVEAQALTVDQRPFLLNVITQHLAQRSMQQVSCRVIQCGGLAYAGVDRGLHLFADTQSALLNDDMVQMGITRLGGIRHLGAQAGGRQITGVTNLATGFGVERGLIQHDHTLVAFVQHLDRLAVAEQRHNSALPFGTFVALETGFDIHLDQGVVIQPELAGGTRALALRFHRCLKAGLIDGQIALTGDITGQVNRKAVGIVQLEHNIAGDLTAFQLGQILLEDAQALIQSLGELFLLGLEHPFDMRLLGLEFRERPPHLGNQRRNDLVEEHALGAQLVAVTAGATDDAAQHIATTFVGRQYAVGNQKAAGTNMVCHYFQ